jgi:hypothetical protein
VKRLPLFIVVLALFVGCFFGAGEIRVWASSIFDKDSSTQFGSNVPYSVLTDPRMLAVGGNRVFLIDDGEGVILNLNDGQPASSGSTFSLGRPFSDVRDIKYVANGTTGYLIIFGSHTFSVWSMTNANPSPNPVSQLTNVHYRDSGTSFSYFDALIWSNRLHIYFAGGASWTPQRVQYGYNTYNLLAAFSEERHDVMTVTSDWREISGIAVDGDRNIILGVINFANVAFVLDTTGGPVKSASDNFGAIASMTSIPKGGTNTESAIAFIVGDRQDTAGFSNSLSYLRRSSNSAVPVPRSSANPDIGASRSPIYVAAYPEGVFVIDRSKRSIDRYEVENGALVFDRPVTAHFGSSKGFYNLPRAMTVIDDSRYVVADLAGQIKMVQTAPGGKITDIGEAEDFLSIGQQSLNLVSAMCYDNSKLVYIFDYDAVSGDRRVSRFNLDGIRQGLPFTGYFTGASNQTFVPFNRSTSITQLFAGADQSIYALDEGNNRIYHLTPGRFSPQNDRFVLLTEYEAIRSSYRIRMATDITPATRGIVSEELNSIILVGIMRQVSADPLVEAEDVVEIKLNTELEATENLDVLNLGINDVLLDITTDTLGNILLLSMRTEILVGVPVERLFLHHFKVDGENREIADEPTAVVNINKNSTRANVDMLSPALSIDMLNSRILWIGRHHAIEAIDLREHSDDWLWSFYTDWEQRPNGTWVAEHKRELHDDLDWNNPRVALLYDAEGKMAASLFRTNPTQDVVIYRYPNAIGPITSAPRGSTFKVLSSGVAFDDVSFEYSFVRFEDVLAGEPREGFVSNRLTIPAPREMIYYDEIGFLPRNGTDSGRIIFDGTRIYKFPSSDNHLTIGRIDKNHVDPTIEAGRGIRILNRLRIVDSQGFQYFEIRLGPIANTQAGRFFEPNQEDGEFVGYIKVWNVTDWDEPPSSIPFMANGRVRFSDPDSAGVQMYRLNENGVRVPLENAILVNKQRISVRNINMFDDLVYVTYWDSDVNQEIGGYIPRKYIVMDGLTAWQIAGIFGMVVGTLCLLVVGIIYVVRKRRAN